MRRILFTLREIGVLEGFEQGNDMTQFIFSTVSPDRGGWSGTKLEAGRLGRRPLSHFRQVRMVAIKGDNKNMDSECVWQSVLA